MTEKELLIEMAKSLAADRCENMRGPELAMFDLTVMLELIQRGAVKDIHLELNVLSMKHLKAAPYCSGILKGLARLFDPKNNIIPFNAPHGGKPCP